uniref:ATP synthase F0 subunit 8 n=1 Tax=Hirudo medicinalis TaxID=6421 RepID=A0A342KB33_HIRME|nr:ATP synthase F0 subunit 8 [Hirudo medicinalis]
MPQLSPMHWLFMLLFCWLLLMNMFSMMWWFNYNSYFKFDCLDIMFSNFKW